MSAVKGLEYQIARQLMRRREEGTVQQGASQQRAVQWHRYRRSIDTWADRLIAILALTTGLLVLGSYLEELLWAAMAATTLVTLR